MQYIDDLMEVVTYTETESDNEKGETWHQVEPWDVTE